MSKVPENPTVEALALDELDEGASPAEQWILKSLRLRQKHSRLAAFHGRRAMSGIAERFYRRLLRYCSKKLGPYQDESPDVVQDVFHDLEKVLDQIENLQHLRKLMFKIAKNKCTDVVKRNQRMVLSEEFYALKSEDAPASRRKLELEHLIDSIGELPRFEDRLIVRLSLRKSLSMREMAELLEITEGACKMRLHRARKKLRALHEEDE